MGKGSKKDRKIAIIKKYLPNCTNTWSVYTYGNIPRKCIDGALSSYSGHIEYDDVLGLIDETIFGSGKKGMIFSCDGFYMDGGNGISRYADHISFNSLPSSYNLSAVNEMLTKLYEIETEPSGWDIAASIFGSAMDFLQTMADEPEDIQEDEDIDPEELLTDDEWIDVINLCVEYLEKLSNAVDKVMSSDSTGMAMALQELIEQFNNGIIDGDEGSISLVCEKVIVAYNKLDTGSEFREMNFQFYTSHYLESATYWLEEIQTRDRSDLELLSKACKEDIGVFVDKVNEECTSLSIISGDLMCRKLRDMLND